MSDLMLDVDQAGELKAAFRRGNWTNAEIKRLSEGDVLTSVRRVLLGHAEIRQVEHVIDCDVNPMIPDGWSIKGDGAEHQKGGQFKWDPAQVNLFLSDKQKNGKRIVGNDLRKELEGKPVLNACVLDYLLAHPHLIPDDWKGKAVFFWGTVYRDSGGYLLVRYLCWNEGRWDWNFSWLGSGWVDEFPAALRAS